MKNKPLNKYLYINSLFSSKEYKLDSNKALTISEASSFSNKSERIALDMISPNPTISNKIDSQWLTFALINGLVAGLFLVLSLTMNLPTIAVFSAVFTMIGVASAFASLQQKGTSYIYHYAETDTPLFTLKSTQTDNKQVKAFVKQLNHAIAHSEIEAQPIAEVAVKESIVTDEEKYLVYTYHLDYLHNSGIIDETLYHSINRKIDSLVFGLKETRPLANVINFPIRKF